MNYMHPVKILYIAAEGDLRGGGPMSLIGILKGLDPKYFKPIVVSPFPGTLVEALKSMNIETVIIKTKSFKKLHLLSFFTGISKFTKLIKEQKIAIVHSNAACSRESFLGVLAANINRVPFIYHVRVLDSAWLLERLLIGLSDKVIVISDAVARRLSWVRSKGKIIRIYNGVNLKEYNPAISGSNLKKELGFCDNNIIIATAGMLVPLKGFTYFLEAASEVIKAYPDAKFIIAGEPIKGFHKYEEKLKSLIDFLRLKDKVFFIGFRREFREVLAITDIFVLPTLREAFGRVLIEAMAMEKPLVATNVGGIPEVVENGLTGILVPPKNPKGISEAVKNLIKDRDRARLMGIAGRKRVEKFFSIEQNVNNIVKLYNDLKN